MSVHLSISPIRQRGDFLLEALIAVLLTALISVGFISFINHLLSVKMEAKVVSATIVQLNRVLEQDGHTLCGRTDVSIQVSTAGLPVDVSCESTQILSVRSSQGVVSFPEPPRITLSVSLDAFDISGPDVVVKSGD